MLIIHCGVFKTGTTSLQETVFPHLKGIAYLGKGPKANEVPTRDLYAQSAASLLSEVAILGSRSPFGKLPNLDIKLEKLILPCVESSQLYLYSNESLLGCQSTQAPEIFPFSMYDLPLSVLSKTRLASRIRFLVAYRQPAEDYLASRFLEIQHWRRNKHMQLLSLPEYLAQQRYIFRMHPEKSFFFHASPKCIYQYFHKRRLDLTLVRHIDLLNMPLNIIMDMAEPRRKGGRVKRRPDHQYKAASKVRQMKHSLTKLSYLDSLYPNSENPYKELREAIMQYCLMHNIYNCPNEP